MEYWETEDCSERDLVECFWSGLEKRKFPGSVAIRVVGQQRPQPQPLGDVASTYDRTVIRRGRKPDGTGIAYKFGGPRFFGWNS